MFWSYIYQGDGNFVGYIMETNGNVQPYFGTNTDGKSITIIGSVSVNKKRDNKSKENEKRLFYKERCLSSDILQCTTLYCSGWPVG